MVQFIDGQTRNKDFKYSIVLFVLKGRLKLNFSYKVTVI